MRILTVMESPSWVDHHLAGSLEAMGHEVVRFVIGTHVGEFYGAARETERRRKNDDLLALATSLTHGPGLDLVFCYVYDDFLLPDHARRLAALDVPLVNYNVDMVNQWYRQSRTARHFTRMLCAQRVNMEHLQRAGGRVHYFPMAAPLPPPPSQQVLLQPAAPVTFVGTPMPYRKRLLGWLLQQQLPLAVYGKWWREQREAAPQVSREKTLSDIRHYAWKRLCAEGPGVLLQTLANRLQPPSAAAVPVLPETVLHGFVPEAAMPSLFRHSRINLGFTRMTVDDPFRPGLCEVKLRDFEVPMAGGFYLVEEAPDYDALFRPGVEVETWRTPGELLEKIRYYLDHPDTAATIAAAGEARARADHSWQRRFADLFAELGLQG